MEPRELTAFPHRRKNILTGEWVLVSPHRTARPWQGEVSEPPAGRPPRYDPTCYLCPGNRRAGGAVNPHFDSTHVFTNDFSSLDEGTPPVRKSDRGLLIGKTEKGICRVVTFTPRHDVTLAEMERGEIEHVIAVWKEEFKILSSHPHINYVQIFENKGQIMGASNPHPHGQIWAQESIPVEPSKEQRSFRSYRTRKGRSLLADYLKLELITGERVVYENASFVVVVPYWSVWPYETLIVSRRRLANLLQFSDTESKDFADALSVVTIKYDNIFRTSFPYSAGMHQAPTDGDDHREWHFHMHFYPPLLRSATIKKFMVGYEMLAEPQRDMTPEQSAAVLRNLPAVRFDAGAHVLS